MPKSPDAANEGYITPGAAAALSFVSTKTLTRLADAGNIAFVRLPSGHRRYLEADVRALLSSPVPSSPVVVRPAANTAGDSSVGGTK